MGAVAKCLAWLAGVLVLVSCHNHRMVSPPGKEAAAPSRKVMASYGQSFTSSYPDASDYRDPALPLQMATPVRSVDLAPAPEIAGNPASAKSRSTPTHAVVHHRVVRGETLFGIGRRYGTTAEALKAANGLKSDTIYPGEVLTIPQR